MIITFVEYGFLMIMNTLFPILSSETTLILIHLSHGTNSNQISPKFKVSHSTRGGGLNPNETLSLSNGKFVFDHGPNQTECFELIYVPRFLNARSSYCVERNLKD